MKCTKVRPLRNGRLGVYIAIPNIGYDNPIAICRRYGFIQCGKVIDSACSDGRRLREVTNCDNIAYRNRSHEA